MDTSDYEKILGVRINNLSLRETKEKILDILEEGIPRQKFVVTLNPEILLKAHRDKNYLAILNQADLNICDGFGLKFVSFLRGKTIKSRFAGADLVKFLLKAAKRRKMKSLVVAVKNSLSSPSEINQAIREQYPGIISNSQYFLPGQAFFESAIIREAEIVFVNFGAPEQEKFIFENRNRFPNARILVGVGGSFDFLTGKIQRAPGFMRKIGFEWLWRIIQEPKRFRRIWNAVVLFPVVSLLEKD